MSKKILDRAAILSFDDVKYEIVDVPEWGGSVRVRAISSAARDDLEQAAFAAYESKTPMKQFRARLVALCVVDDAGVQIFSDADIEALGNKSGAAMDRIYSACTKLNALSKADVKELEKN